MRFLHVSLSSVRMMDTYTRMIRNNFPEEEHRFLYCDEVGGDDRKLLEYGNSREAEWSLRQKFRTICEEFDAADYIIWHGLMSGAKRVLIPLVFRKYMRKSVWIIRGIDLYNWRKQERGPKSWAINFVNYHGRKDMPYVCVIFEPDEEVYHQQFGRKAKVFYTPYPLSENAFASMESLRGRAPRANGKVYIQVAHNAYAFNHHLELLDALAQYRDENIRVVLPLSYGNDWYNQKNGYVAEVQKRADDYFGDKAVCLKRLMPAEKYTDALCDIDVSVYGAHRQNALGNIFRSLYVGNKVFLPRDNPVYTCFTANGIELGCTDDIEKMSFEEFVKPLPSDKAVAWIREHHHPEASVVYWKDMFETLRCRKEGKTYVPSDEQRQQEIRRRLAKVFPETEQGGAVRRKLNYIDFSRYVALPRNTVLADVQSVVIAGAGRLGQSVCCQMFRSNENGMKWDVRGLADEELACLPEDIDGCDVIGRIEDIRLEEGDGLVNALETAAQRGRFLERLPAEKQAALYTYCADTAVIERGAAVAAGCTVIGHSYIHAGSTVGRCCLLRSAAVECGAVLGECCVLLHDSWVGEGAVLGRGVTVGAFARIAPGVTVGDGCTVEPFSVVKEDITGERGAVCG